MNNEKLVHFPPPHLFSRHNAKWSLYMFIFVLYLYYWSRSSTALATWCEELIHWKRPWCWQRLKAGEEKRMTKDEMAGWHHWVDGHEFKQALGVGDEQGSLACFSQWGCKELDMTERLNWICVIKCYNKCINYIVRFLSVWWSLTPSSCRQTGLSENILCSYLLSSPPHFLLDVSFLHCHGMCEFTLRGPHFLLSLLYI